jgi:hypothetical protein
MLPRQLSDAFEPDVLIRIVRVCDDQRHLDAVSEQY